MPAFVGVDIGGTKSAIGLLREGEAIEGVVVPTEGFAATVGALVSAIRELAPKPDGIGIACTGPLDEAAGVVLNADTLDGWAGQNLRAPFAEAFGGAVPLHNDADAALLGELAMGRLRDRRGDPAAMLTLGTGVGGAVWLGDRLLTGAKGQHPEIGHMLIASDGPECYCGARGCLESLVSGPALNARSRTLGFSSLVGAIATGHASGLLEEVREHLGRAVLTLGHAFAPSSVLFGGGVIEATGARLLPRGPVPLAMLTHAITIETAELGNRAGWIGAAWAAEREAAK